MSVADLLMAWADLEEAMPDYEEAELNFKGEVDEVFADPKIKDKLAKTGEAYRFNLIKTAVTVRASRCEITTIKVPKDEASTKLISRVWKANQMAIHYPILISDTLEYGDAYTMVFPLEAETLGPDEEADAELVRVGLEITTQNPKNCRVIYDPENQRLKRLALKRWQVTDDRTHQPVWRCDLWYRDRVEHYVQVAGGNVEQPEGWTFWEEEDETGDTVTAAIEPHDLGEIPFFHHRTGLPYGRSVMADGYGAQHAINKMLITQLTTTDSQGFPQRYQLLEKDAVLDENNDTPDWVDDGLATSVEVGGLSQRGGQVGAMRTGPGTVQQFTGTAEVGQFPAAGPEVFLDPATFYIRLMAQETTTPLHYFDPAGDQPSGESLKTAEAPLVKDIEWLQLLQESTVEEEWRFALRLLGQDVPDLDVRWAPVASATGLSDWQTADAKISVGVPVDQVLTEAGYEPEQVATWLDSSAEANTLAARVALLNTIGTAVQALGAGVSLGVLSQESASAAISVVLGQVTESGQDPTPA